MSEWKPKRFWSSVIVVPSEDGFEILLDDKPLRTPGKTPLILPTCSLALHIAAEWEAQTGLIDPRRMPATRMANSAIEKVRPQRAEVAALLTAYGETDHLCYRAVAPEALFARQVAAWDPVLDWAADVLGARLATGQGVIPIAQDPVATARLAARVDAFDAFGLAAFHDLVSLSGSLILALGVTEGFLDAPTAWDLSRIDEIWQTEVWGHDEDAAAVANLKSAAFLDAARFYRLVSVTE